MLDTDSRARVCCLCHCLLSKQHRFMPNMGLKPLATPQRILSAQLPNTSHATNIQVWERVETCCAGSHMPFLPSLWGIHCPHPLGVALTSCSWMAESPSQQLARSSSAWHRAVKKGTLGCTCPCSSATKPPFLPPTLTLPFSSLCPGENVWFHGFPAIREGCPGRLGLFSPVPTLLTLIRI